MKKNIRYTIFALCCFALSISCKKDKTISNCLLKSLISQSGSNYDTINYTYNNDKKVISAIDRTNQTTYTYFGQTVERFSVSEFNTFRDSIIYGSNGLMKEVYNFDETGVKTRQSIYTYDAQNNLTQFVETEFPAATTTITNVTYANGDLASISDGTSTTLLEFYTNKSAALGDYLNLFQFNNFGGYYFQPKHLVKSLKIDDNPVTSFAYEFDNYGNVSKLTITEGATLQVFNMSYLCN